MAVSNFNPGVKGHVEIIMGWPNVLLFIFKNKLIYLFIYFWAALGLRCCAPAFSSCGERGLLFVAVCGLLIVMASLCCGAWALGTWASVVVACSLSSCGAWA